MNEQKHEQLSALVDDELTHETSSVINHLMEDDNARGIWARYQLIGDSLRGHLPEHIVDISDDVSAEIASQPAILAPAKALSNRKSSDLKKPMMGFAIAASVAAVAIFNVQQARQAPSVGEPAVTQSSIASNAVPLVIPQLAAQQNDGTQGHQTQSSDPRLSRYLVNYNEYRVNTGVRGMPPHVRMVANGAAITK